ncbi:MAG TPA: C25 family cysteine peptidase, partial [Chloroflexota bacterium]|nr:C25 family cysteine peptidase [Chloroflexota bacterium]
AVAVIRWQLRHGDLDRALDAVSRLMITRPGDVYLLLGRLEALWRAERFRDAERAARQLLARHPRFQKVRLIYGHLLTSDPERELLGLEMLHQAFASDPSATVAQALFRGASVHPPILSFDLNLDLPSELTRTPTEVEAALGVLPAMVDDDADAEWAPSDPPPTDLMSAGHNSARSRKPLAFASLGQDEDSSASTTYVEHGQSILGRVLAVSCRGPLVSRYGYDGFQRLGRRMQTVARELGEDGLEVVTVFVDDPASMGQHGLDTVSMVDCEQIKRAIDRLIEVNERDHAKVTALLILGGDDIVPFFHLPNPADDDDPTVPTDNPYAVRPGGSIYAPDLAIGRLPDGAGGNLGLLLRQIDTLLEVRRKPTISTNGLSFVRAGRFALGALGLGKSNAIGFACTTAAWRETTEQTLASFGPETLFRASPPTLASEMDARLLAGRRLLHFNLHGVPDRPAWYGQDLPGAGEEEHLPVVLTPDQLSASDLNAPVVFSNANYSAHIFSKSSAHSLSLRFLSEGAAAFVGATVGSYGAAQPPLEASDLLAQLFWDNVQRGDWIGSALQRARRQYVQSVMERQGFLDGDDQKTLLEFVLYGDPLCALYQPMGDDEAEDVLPNVSLLCNQSKTPPNGKVASPALLRSAIELALKLTPDVASGSVRTIRRVTCLGSCLHRG